MRRILLAGILIATAGGAGSCGGREKDRAPDFRLRRLHGGRFYLHDYRGSIVVLLFWSTRCSACIREIPAVTAIARPFGDAVTVAAICVDPENRDEAARIASAEGFDCTVLLDTGGVARRYGVDAVPVTVVIDGSGRAVLRRRGFDEHVLASVGDAIERLAAEQAE